MATVRECEKALRVLASRLNKVEPALLERHGVDRTLSCHVLDLEVDFSGRIHEGVFIGLKAQPDPDAQVRVTITSDDLVALTQSRLNIASAWATGRIKIDASVFDLLRLRSLL